MSNSVGSPAIRLRQYFTKAVTGPQIAGAEVLQELSNLASACVNGTSTQQDSVAFTLSTVLEQHAEDMDDRPVTGNDAYRLLAAGGEHFSEAVKFIEDGGNADDSTRIIAALARLTPDRLNGRWPPKI